MTVAYPIVGIDISSTALDCALLGADGKFAASSADNTKTAAKKLARTLAKQKVALVVFESTGGYENLLMAALAAEEVPFARANPRQVPSLRPVVRTPTIRRFAPKRQSAIAVVMGGRSDVHCQAGARTKVFSAASAVS
jgi:transposase